MYKDTAKETVGVIKYRFINYMNLQIFHFEVKLDSYFFLCFCPVQFGSS